MLVVVFYCAIFVSVALKNIQANPTKYSIVSGEQFVSNILSGSVRERSSSVIDDTKMDTVNLI